jgi:hypothetical protein
MVGRWMATLGIVAALAFATAAGARGEDKPAAASADRCPIGGVYRVTSVTPDQHREQGYAPEVVRLRGADIVVAAQPGLTREWLQRSVERGVATGDCNFGARDLKVSVVSAGDTFEVRLTTADERAAREVLRRAQQLVPNR